MKNRLAQIRRELKRNLDEIDSGNKIVVATYLFGSNVNEGAGPDLEGDKRELSVKMKVKSSTADDRRFNHGFFLLFFR